MTKRTKETPNPDCPECNGDGYVLVWYWADGDRQVAEREDCPVCYPVNQVPYVVGSVVLMTVCIAAFVVVGLVKAGVWP